MIDIVGMFGYLLSSWMPAELQSDRFKQQVFGDRTDLSEIFT
jgi:hypothetical protein